MAIGGSIEASSLQLPWVKPATVVTRYDNEEESRRDGRHEAKHPKEDTIDNSGQLAPLDDDRLAVLGKLLTVKKVADQTVLVGGYVETVRCGSESLIGTTERLPVTATS